MTPIDFQNLDAASLAYLFLGHYHDQDGVYRTVRIGPSGGAVRRAGPAAA